MRKINPFRKIFVDSGGNYTGFKWWFRWTIAFWHLRKWLEYEGKPKEIKNINEVLKWEARIVKKV